MVTGVFKLFLLVSMVTGIFYFAYRPSWQWVLEPTCPDWKQHYRDQVRLFSLLSSSFSLSLPLSRLLFFLFSLLILSPPLPPSLPPFPPSLPPSLLLLFSLLPSPSHLLSLLLFSFPHSAQLSLGQKEASHLNLNLLTCQQLSGRSKVGEHHAAL